MSTVNGLMIIFCFITSSQSLTVSQISLRHLSLVSSSPCVVHALDLNAALLKPFRLSLQTIRETRSVCFPFVPPSPNIEPHRSTILLLNQRMPFLLPPNSRIFQLTEKQTISSTIDRQQKTTTTRNTNESPPTAPTSKRPLPRFRQIHRPTQKQRNQKNGFLPLLPLLLPPLLKRKASRS